jgi:hypothetical protein
VRAALPLFLRLHLFYQHKLLFQLAALPQQSTGFRVSRETAGAKRSAISRVQEWQELWAEFAFSPVAAKLIERQ